jgi:glycosyltransferase involved in cell wall biosynthesis
MTVQNKIWEAAAMARPILSGDSATVREAFRHGEEIYLTQRGEPAALAEAIRLLVGDPALCERLGGGAFRRFQQGHSVAALGALARDILLDVQADR